MITSSGAAADSTSARRREPKAAAGSGGAGRSRLALGGLAVVTVLVMAAGTWGVLASREGHVDLDHAARPGAAVKVPGGLLRVDAVRPLEPQHKMAGMDPDPVPEGFRRISVDVSVQGSEPDGLRFPASRFRLAGKGMEAVGSRQHSLGNAIASPGSTVSGNLVFQYPEKAENLVLSFQGGSRSIALQPGPAPLDHHR